MTTTHNNTSSTNQHQPSASSSLADRPSNGNTTDDANSPRGEDDTKEVALNPSTDYVSKIKFATLDDVEIVEDPTIPINKPSKKGTNRPTTRLKSIKSFTIHEISLDDLRKFCAQNKIYRWVYETNKDGNMVPKRTNMRAVKKFDACEQIARYRAAYEIEKAKQDGDGDIVNLPVRALAGPPPEEDPSIYGDDDDNNVAHEIPDQGVNASPSERSSDAEKKKKKSDDHDDVAEEAVGKKKLRKSFMNAYQVLKKAEDDDDSGDEASGKKKSGKSSMNEDKVLQVGMLEENYRSLSTFIDSRLDRIKLLKEQLYVAKSKTGQAMDGRNPAKKALKRRREQIMNRKSLSAVDDSDASFDNNDDDSSQGSLVKEIVDCELEVSDLKKRKTMYGDNICARLN